MAGARAIFEVWEKAMNQVWYKKNFAVFLLLSGALAVLVALGSDLLGFGERGGFGVRQMQLLAGGALALAVGLLLDWRSQEQHTRVWLKDLAGRRVELGHFAVAVLQLGALALVARQYALENASFYNTIMGLAFWGFILHHLLPAKLRMPFFLLLSLAGIMAVLGYNGGFWLIGIGLALIGITFLPITFGWRVAILAATGVLLAVFRGGWLESAIPNRVWPIIGSMFMFRLIIYMYDWRHQKDKPGFIQAASYFFLLPNVVFPLFPVVDFTQFRRTYFNAESIAIYQKGISWIFRGILHLLAYRVVNYNFIFSPENVTDVVSLGQLITANFLLYLRVSGQFHIIIGILHLFGFNLPESHHLYLLATSFTEFWRRINIYWKDFIQKIFFYPIIFKIKKLNEPTKLVLATLLSFFATWFLHVYQWFWLRGSFFINLPDILFWTILAILVLFNILGDTRKSRKKTIKPEGLPIRELVARTLKATGMFLFMISLWYMWTSPTLEAWWSVLKITEYTVSGLLTLLGWSLIIPLIFGISIWVENGGLKGVRFIQPTAKYAVYRSAAGMILVSGFLFTLADSAVIPSFPPAAQKFMLDVRLQHLNVRDAELLERGYYEDLIGSQSLNSDLWRVYLNQPKNWPNLVEIGAAELLPDSFLEFVLRPNLSLEFHGAHLTTNRWGMRDQDYELARPANTFRIALIGASRDMGSGVANQEIFEAIVEDRLNADFEGKPYDHYEFLNFSIGGYNMLQKQYFLETQQAFDFQPDMVIVVPHPEKERLRSLTHLYQMQAHGVEIPYAYLRDLLARAGVIPATTEVEAINLLAPYGDEMLAWSLNETARLIRDHNAVPVFLIYPYLSPLSDTNEDLATMIELAEQAGFVLVNLNYIYDGFAPASLIVAEWDVHPNAVAHGLIAQALYRALLDQGLIPVTDTP